MSNFSIFVFVSIISISILFCLHAGSFACPEFKTKSIQKLDNDLRLEFSKPNRWGYSVLIPPRLTRMGYTYSLDVLINLEGIPMKSISEIERVHSTIYGEILSKLNSIKQIRPFLGKFPLSLDSFSLSIGFVDKNGRHVPPPCFMSIVMRPNDLEFIQQDDKSLTNPCRIVLKKSTLDSDYLKKYSHSMVKRSIEKEKPKVPQVSYILTCCPPFHQSVFDFSETICKKNSLNFIGLSSANSEFKDETPFNLILWGSAQLTKDSARKLAAECSREFLKFVQNDKRTLEFMVERSKNEHVHDDAIFPEVRHIGFRISFWDDNIDRQIEPFIAEIRMFEGRIKYFTADDGQRLVLVHEESFEDAQAFLNSIAGG